MKFDAISFENGVELKEINWKWIEKIYFSTEEEAEQREKRVEGERVCVTWKYHTGLASSLKLDSRSWNWVSNSNLAQMRKIMNNLTISHFFYFIY
jgi:hypothetical protein